MITDFNNRQLNTKQRRKNKPMNITLVYCWGNNNAGDKAITPGTLELLHQTFPESQITVVSRILPNSRGLNALMESEFVILNGGHLLFWSKRMGDKLGNLLNVYPLMIARRLRIPYGLYAQSLGPFEFGCFGGLVKIFYRWLFSGSSFIYTRESMSQSNLKSLGVKRNNIIQVVFFN